MKKLVIVRHGTYGADDKLNDDGRKEINLLAENLKKVLFDGIVKVLTSPADRARESAEIICSVLGVGECEQHEVLWSDEDHLEDYDKAFDLIKDQAEDSDILILVTHFEYADHLPEYFAQEVLKKKINSWKIKKGEAFVLDCEKATLTHIS